jgi:biofilm PGA synthesis N-glycosyltransferase PgaC
MTKSIFWFSFAFIFYVYIGYPALLWVWRGIRRQPILKGYWEPTVSLLIAAHNEQDNIEAKITNCLKLDYPQNKLQIIISLDGPIDGTELVVRKYCGSGVEMLHSPIHRGKAAALNCGIEKATGEIVVFTDARQQFDLRAVRELVGSFQDSRVGAVTGELVLLDENSKEACDGAGLYWRYEKRLRAMESDIHSMVGATGAIYAIRRELFEPLPDDTLLDDVMVPMRIVLAGRRAVFDPAARAYDCAPSTPEVEFRRKVRTLAGNYQLMARIPELLVPLRNPVFWQFVSHKAGRLLVPYFLVALFLSNLFLTQGIYLVFLLLQLAWYLMAFAGHLLIRDGKRGPAFPSSELSGREKAA